MYTLGEKISSYKDTIVFAEHSEKVDGDLVKLRVESVFDIMNEREISVDHRIFKTVIDSNGDDLLGEIVDRFYNIGDAIREFNDYVFGVMTDDFHIVDAGSNRRPVFGEGVYLNFVVVKGKSHSHIFGEKEIYELRQLIGNETHTIMKSIASFAFCRTIAEFLSTPEFDTIWKEAKK